MIHSMNNDIYKSDYFYELPEELIAKFPLENRSDSKLLTVNNNDFEINIFSDIENKINKEDLLILNETKVFQARLELIKKTGGKVEILILEKINKYTANCLTRGLNRDIVHQKLFTDQYPLDIKILPTKDTNFLKIEFSQPIDQICLNIGSMPIPPYLKRAENKVDVDRYQSVFANEKYSNSVAAPTASLHFDKTLLDRIKQKTHVSTLCLDVGYGTFQPIKDDLIDANATLHKENFFIPDDLRIQIKSCKGRGGKIIALGTTTLRALESAFDPKKQNIRTGNQSTDIFIKEGYKFKIVDKLITNFHLPESSLLMLVCAFGGKSNILNAYKYAIKHSLRFYSYGDAMIIEKCLSKY